MLQFKERERENNKKLTNSSFLAVKASFLSITRSFSKRVSAISLRNCFTIYLARLLSFSSKSVYFSEYIKKIKLKTISRIQINTYTAHGKRTTLNRLVLGEFGLVSYRPLLPTHASWIGQSYPAKNHWIKTNNTIPKTYYNTEESSFQLHWQQRILLSASPSFFRVSSCLSRKEALCFNFKAN